LEEVKRHITKNNMRVKGKGRCGVDEKNTMKGSVEMDGQGK